MPDGTGFVSWDRWDAEHRALSSRVEHLEAQGVDLTDAQQEATASLAELKRTVAVETAGEQNRRQRVWVLALGLLTAIVCPVIVSTIITLLHLKAAGK